MEDWEFGGLAELKGLGVWRVGVRRTGNWGVGSPQDWGVGARMTGEWELA